MTHFRFAIRVMAVALCLGLPACQPSRQAFQLDSDSRTPMLGLEFTPRNEAPDVTGIANREGSQGEVPAPAGPAQQVPVEAGDDPSAWSKLWGKFTRPKRIPLPRTDGEAPDEDRTSPANSAVPSQADFS